MGHVNQLTQILSKSSGTLTLRDIQWDDLVHHAKRHSLLARIKQLLEEEDLLRGVPSRVRQHLESAETVVENEHRVMRWEVNRIRRALRQLETPVVLLKGAAYLVGNLPISRGRISTDVDLLVPKEDLGKVEKALLTDGWAHIKLQDYDQYFYRQWSHELPPLVHRDRGTVVDVHHTILPPTGRLHPNPEKLIAASIPLEGTRFRVLAPADMVLHSAAHAFQDGDLSRGLRDLVDIDDLLRHFSQKENFWNELTTRAEELELSRPIYYALRYSHRYLDTPIPEGVLAYSKRWQPAWLASAIMDAIVNDVVTAGPWREDWLLKLARQLLYIRSHWLRMPPYLLIPHLFRKALKRSPKSV